MANLIKQAISIHFAFSALLSQSCESSYRFSRIGEFPPIPPRQTPAFHRPLITLSSATGMNSQEHPRGLAGGFLMKKTLAITLFMLATLAWAMAQQPDSTAGQ